MKDSPKKMEGWKIVESISDKHPEFGYPMGQVLCKDLKEAEDYIKKSEFRDCIIKNYTLDAIATTPNE